ncbi:MAG: uridine diphosphate-N-acetylglucosamine-binding protein YvcK [Anaerolineae bacterium]|nr:uridine diphosphate-N-acetylglucosamine-binding protein YvcK [Anaerolineae bacterium]
MGRRKFTWASLIDRRRWLTLGIGVKRWMLVLAAGTIVASLGWINILLEISRAGWVSSRWFDWITLQFLPGWVRIVLPLLLGGLIISLALVKLGKNLVEPLRGKSGAVVDSLYEYRRRERGPRIVAVGGGTGMPGLLRGLTSSTSNITAIVTVADDGGSSGRLRKELGLLPPGDFRNNLAALARDEALMTQVLQYRFGGQIDENGQGSSEQGLQGHAFGNLLLAALTGITGSFDEALLAAQRVLALRGQVLPSTLENLTLTADVALPEGEVVRVAGESTIPQAGGRIERLYLDPDNARAYPPALRAIFQADLVVLGPGSLYTSILPNLLVADLAQALLHTRARVVYVCNLATQPGETDGYSVVDHVEVIRQHTSDNLIDIVLANDNLSVPPDTGGGHTTFVIPTIPAGVEFITRDLVDEARPWRHDSAKLANAVLELLS